MKKNKSKKSLDTLRELVDNLSNRDVKAKRDMKLFEDFFENFPIPVTIWALSSEGTVVSQRGNGLVCEDAKCLKTLFFKAQEDECIEAHRQALTGKPVQKLVETKEKTYYMSIVPRRDESENISGVVGLAWDVTPNHEMLETFKEIIFETKKETPSFGKIRKMATSSLKVSRLAKLLDKKA